MTLAELKTMLDATGYPVAYSHWKKTATDPVPDPPYILYLVAFSSNFIADNKVYQKIENAQVELYTNYKDLQAEAKLEDLLDQNEIPWEATETWIESESLYERIYEIGVI